MHNLLLKGIIKNKKNKNVHNLGDREMICKVELIMFYSTIPCSKRNLLLKGIIKNKKNKNVNTLGHREMICKVELKCFIL